MSQMQFQAPRLSQTNKIILATSGVCFLIFSILKAIGAFSLVGLLGLSGKGLMSGMIFQLLTYPFVETQLMGFIFNSLLIWFIGSELESLWGSRLYSRFLGLTVVSVGLVYALVNILFFYGTQIFGSPLHGLSGINFALLIAYATLYPDRQLSLMLIFPMRARTFCWILVAIEAYMAIFSSMSTSWAHLMAMGISYLLINYQHLPFLKKLLNFTWSNKSASKKSAKKHLYVIKDDDNQNPPKYWQ